MEVREITKAQTPNDLERKYNFGAMKKAIEATSGDTIKVQNELNTFVDEVANSVENLQSQIDGNITTWFFSGIPTLLNEPAINWITEGDKNNHLGDLYYDQATGYAYRFALSGMVYEWIKITDNDVTEALAVANAARDVADSKRRVFVVQPTPPYDVGDLWVGDDTSDMKRSIVSRLEGDDFNPLDWILATKYTDDTVALEAIGIADTLAQNVEINYVSNANLVVNNNEVKTEVIGELRENDIKTIQTEMSVLSQTTAGLRLDLTKSGGNNLIPNSLFDNRLGTYRPWRTHFAQQLVSGVIPPTNPTANVTYWYCEAVSNGYLRGSIYKWTGTIWELTNLDKSFFDTLNLDDNIIPYQDTYTMSNSISGRFIRIDGHTVPKDVEHIFLASDDIHLDVNQRNLTFSCKLKQNIVTGNAIVGVALIPEDHFNPDVSGTFLTAYEEYKILTPDVYKELTEIEINIKVPQKSELLTGSFVENQVEDQIWFKVEYGVINAYKYTNTAADGETPVYAWVFYSEYRPVHCTDDGTVYIYRPLLSTYYTSGIPFDDYICKTAIQVMAFYPGFDIQYVESNPMPRPNTYWAATGTTVKRAKFINGAFDSWEETGIQTADTINWLSAPPFPTPNGVPLSGYYEVSDLKLEYGSSKTIWSLALGELYGKSFSLTRDGLRIESKTNVMIIDEDTIRAVYGESVIMEIDGEWARFKNLAVEKIIQNGGWVTKAEEINGYSHLIEYKVGD